MTFISTLTDAQFLALLAAVCVVSMLIGAGLAVMVVCWPAMGPYTVDDEPYGDVPRVQPPYEG